MNSQNRIPLDETDRKILSLLQADCRLTLTEVADKVGLSVSPCHRRIKRMEENGVVLRYAALVDPRAVGLPVSVFVSIKLERQKERELELFSKAIAKWPEVVECYLMTGDSDYLIRVAIADMSALERFILEQLTPIPGVEKIRSSFALKQVRYKTALPLKVAGTT